MSRTQGRHESDLANYDGQIFVGSDAISVTSGTATQTRNAAGDFSLNVGNSQTMVMRINLKALFRYGQQDWLQEQFGSGLNAGAQGLPVGGYTTLSTASASAGSNVSVAVLNSANFVVGRTVMAGAQKTYITAIADATHITLASLTATLASASVITENLFVTPAGVTGVPPFTGVSNLVPVTSPRPKGIKVRQIYPWYLVAGAALTTNTVGVTTTVAANATALAVTTLLTNAANGLQTATQATPYLTPIQIASPVFITAKYSSYDIEWDVTTAGGGTANIYGVFLDCDFNYV